jgi:hypothetical protein
VGINVHPSSPTWPLDETDDPVVYECAVDHIIASIFGHVVLVRLDVSAIKMSVLSILFAKRAAQGFVPRYYVYCV